MCLSHMDHIHDGGFFLECFMYGSEVNSLQHSDWMSLQPAGQMEAGLHCQVNDTKALEVLPPGKYTSSLD